jgi:hypothetical protein
MLAPPLAALVAIGAVELWRIGEEQTWLAIGLLLPAAAGTLGFQIATAQVFVDNAWWLGAGALLLVIGAGLLAAAASRRLGRWRWLALSLLWLLSLSYRVSGRC